MKIFRICILGLLLSIGVRAGEIDDFVLQLGAGSFAEREVASQELWKIGTPALDAVRKAVQSKDPEMRMRAQKLYPLLKMGIRPDWPDALRERGMRSDKMTEAELRSLLEEVADQMGVEAVPFLIAHSQGPAEKSAIDLLMECLNDPEAAKMIMAQLAEPATERQCKLLTEALLLSDAPDALQRALKLPHLQKNERKKLINKAVDDLLAMAGEEDYQTLRDEAALYAALVPGTARFLYLQGAGEAHLGKMEVASGLINLAQSLDPEEEAPHYHAGLLLQKLGQQALAGVEWSKILEIPPKDEVYDINAYLHLGEIHEKRGDPEKAAITLSHALRLYRKAKEEGHGMGMVGSDEAGLEARIAELRSQGVGKQMGEEPLQTNLKAFVKDDRGPAYKVAVNKTVMQMTMKVQPYGFRLFEKAPVRMGYNVATKQLDVFLNDRPMNKGTLLEVEEGTHTFLMRNLDMRYIYEVNTLTGDMVKLESFEVDYLLHITPNERVRALKEPKLILDGDLVTWEALKTGIPYDFLPEKISFSMEALNEEGHNVKAEINFDPREKVPNFP